MRDIGEMLVDHLTSPLLMAAFAQLIASLSSGQAPVDQRKDAFLRFAWASSEFKT
jgi:hypothetical protein